MAKTHQESSDSVRGIEGHLDPLAGDSEEEELAARTRELRRKRRLAGLTQEEDLELDRLQGELDRPARDELERLRMEEEQDRLRFRQLLQEFDGIMRRLARKADGG